jgi:hypothetical protein
MTSIAAQLHEYKWKQFFDLPIPCKCEAPIGSPIYYDRYYTDFSIGYFLSNYLLGRDTTRQVSYVDGETGFRRLFAVGIHLVYSNLATENPKDFYLTEEPTESKPLTRDECIYMGRTKVSPRSYLTINRVLLRHIVGRRNWKLTYPMCRSFKLTEQQIFDLCCVMNWTPLPNSLEECRVISNVL